jgi:hypothetical protein
VLVNGVSRKRQVTLVCRKAHRSHAADAFLAVAEQKKESGNRAEEGLGCRPRGRPGTTLGCWLKCVDGRFHLAPNELQCVAVDVALMFDLFEQRLDAKEPYSDPGNRFGGVGGHQQIMTIVHVIVICWLI